MPPWGEFADHKVSQIAAISQGVPILKEEEIQFLSDWLFSTLRGGEVAKRGEVLKWKYNPEDVIQELKREREQIQPLPQRDGAKDKAQRVSSAWVRFNRSYADFSPISKREEIKELTVEDLFDVVPNPTDTHEKGYYIKKRYYSPHNIGAGKEFFLVNCAICHDNEGEGSGKRSEVMQGAKPRMLTNLDWIRSRDDLRLLRSIKYGVPGTAMTPWGDFTSSLQQLQLVIFIRSLSEEHEKREKLSQALY